MAYNPYNTQVPNQQVQNQQVPNQQVQQQQFQQQQFQQQQFQQQQFQQQQFQQQQFQQQQFQQLQQQLQQFPNQQFPQQHVQQALPPPPVPQYAENPVPDPEAEHRRALRCIEGLERIVSQAKANGTVPKSLDPAREAWFRTFPDIVQRLEDCIFDMLQMTSGTSSANISDEQPATAPPAPSVPQRPPAPPVPQPPPASLVPQPPPAPSVPQPQQWASAAKPVAPQPTPGTAFPNLPPGVPVQTSANPAPKVSLPLNPQKPEVPKKAPAETQLPPKEPNESWVNYNFRVHAAGFEIPEAISEKKGGLKGQSPHAPSSKGEWAPEMRFTGPKLPYRRFEPTRPAKSPTEYGTDRDGKPNNGKLRVNRYNANGDGDQGLCLATYTPGKGCQYRDSPDECRWNHNLSQEVLDWLIKHRGLTVQTANGFVDCLNKYLPRDTRPENKLKRYPLDYPVGRQPPKAPGPQRPTQQAAPSRPPPANASGVWKDAERRIGQDDRERVAEAQANAPGKTFLAYREGPTIDTPDGKSYTSQCRYFPAEESSAGRQGPAGQEGGGVSDSGKAFE